MKNLEKYNVQKISDNEVKEISGGFPWNPVFLAIYIIDEIYEGATRDCDSSCSH